MRSLTNSVKTIRVLAPVAAGTSAQTTSIVDVSNFETVRFMIGFGTITSGAVTSIKIQGHTLNQTSGMSDLLGTSITVADTDDNTIVIAEVMRPIYRYLQCTITRGTQNAVIDLGIAELGFPRKLPVVQDASVQTSFEISAGGVAGTA